MMGLFLVSIQLAAITTICGGNVFINTIFGGDHCHLRLFWLYTDFVSKDDSG